jgi:hypothetical protein
MVINVGKLGAGTMLLLGLLMAAWGGFSFAHAGGLAEQNPDADIGIRICPPTIGELLGLGPAGRKLGNFALFAAGLVLVCAAAIKLMPEEQD